jgi:proteasome accessory factor B
MPGSAPIGAVRFTLQEARAVYLATRLLLRHADKRDPDSVSALVKLADALPPALSRHANATASQITTQPENDPQVMVLRVLTEAWAESRVVRIGYRSQNSRSTKQTDIEPYLIEPSATGAAVYVFGFSREHREIRTYKLDRIASAEPTGEHFIPPDLGDLRSRLAQSWGGTVIAEDEFDVTLEFAPEVADRVRETAWHPSQRLTNLPGGGLRFQVRLPSLLEFIPWVRSWGAQVRVVAPDDLRAEIAAGAEAAAALYRS